MRIVYTSFLIFVLALGACSKSFLEKAPVGQVGKEELFEDVSGLITALNGNYTLVSNFYMTEYGMYGDIRSDNVELSRISEFSLSDAYQYQSDEENPLQAGAKIWQKGYEALNNINVVINSAKELNEDFPKEKHRIDSVTGQALVLRALMHFSIAQVYSQHYTYTGDGAQLGIPVLSETPYPGTEISRPTLKETYEHILTDLNDAIDLLTIANNTNRITASVEAAKAFRSRIYLYMENWDEVVSNTNELIDNSYYTLADAEQYEQLFIASAQISSPAGRSKEVIWQLNGSKVKSDFIQVYYSDPNNFVASPSAALLNLYEAGDVRHLLFKQSNALKYYSGKYGREASVSYENWPVSYKLFRLAEMYLNRAEANWQLNNFELAADDLKIIQARALNIPVTEVNLDYASNQELYELIKIERRKELAFEGHRIFDIMRYKENLNRGEDCVANVCFLSYPSNLFVLPIPRLELDANPAMQPNPEVNK